MVQNKDGPVQRFVRTSVSLVIIMAIALAVPACRQQSPQQTGVPGKITLAYSITPSAGLIQIAFAKGYFDQEGLNVLAQPHTFGKLALKSVFDGKADLATAADTPIMFSVMAGKKTSILAVVQTSNRNTAIVVRKDRGIAGPSDLKGKKIGVTKGTTSDFFLEIFMTVHRINRNQISLIDLRPDEMTEAINTDRVDAATAFNPTLAQLQLKLGKMGLTFYGESIYTEYFCLAAQQDYVHKHPEAVRKVLRALVKAEAFVRDHPEESRGLIAEFTKVDKALIDKAWADLNFRVTLDQGLLVNLEDQTRWAIKNNLTDKGVMPNYLDFIYMDGLQAIKPEAVRIIH
jgi:ABC-type nitrate/sulfonate/bicarbonate transport system substrate-binding protein